MQRFQHILVGVDLSSGDRLAADDLTEATREAIKQALQVAELLDVNLTFFASLDISAQAEELMAHDTEHVTHSVDDDALAVLRHIQEQATERGIQSDVHFAHGTSGETIIRKVLRDNHDLVIVGTKEHTSFGRILFGTTGMKLLRYCPCPVWITKPGVHDKEIINVLVADDLTDTGWECLRLAINGGQRIKTRTHVLHVVEEKRPGWFTSKVALEEQARERDQKISAAETKLEERLTGLDYRTLEQGVQVFVKSGQASEEIVKMIEEHEIDLLIMGTSGRAGISKMFFGSTVERLLPQITCSLLAVKPAEFVSPIKDE